MALHLNSVNVAGNLTRDPIVRNFDNDKCVCDFGIAINRKYRKGDGEMQEETTFLDVECWNKQAQLCAQYLSKGRNVMIEGSLKLDQWENKEGEKRSKIKISAQRVHFIGSPQESKPEEKQDDIAFESEEKKEAAQAQQEIKAESATVTGSPDDDEPPF